MTQRIICLVFLFSACFSIQAQSPDLPRFTVVPGQVSQASVELDTEGRAILHLDLNSGKRAEFADFTKRYLDRQVEIIVDGKSLVQPVIKDEILSGSMSLPCSSPEMAQTLAKHLMSK